MRIVKQLSELQEPLDKADLLEVLFETRLDKAEISELKRLFDDEESDVCINRYLLLFAIAGEASPNDLLVENELRWHTNFLWFAAYLARATEMHVYKDVLIAATRSKNIHIAETSSNLLSLIKASS